MKITKSFTPAVPEKFIPAVPAKLNSVTLELTVDEAKILYDIAAHGSAPEIERMLKNNYVGSIKLTAGSYGISSLLGEIYGSLQGTFK
jgi:hypothetical protein